MTEELLTVKDVAELTGISEYTIRKKLREGEIKGKRRSDREGYRVSRDDLLDYLQKAKKSIPVELAFSGGLGVGLATGSTGLLCSIVSPFAVALGAGVAGVFTSLFSKVNDALREKRGNYKEVLELSIDSLRHRIEALRYSIQALELKGDSLSVEEKQKILEGKAQIELLEQQINELKLKFEVD